MHTQLFSSSPFEYSVVILLISVTISTCYGQGDEQFSNCSNNTYNCGQNVQGIGYPFWGDSRPEFCGHREFKLTCQNGEYPTIEINDLAFRVLGINQSSHLITIARLDLWDTYCVQEFRNITLNDMLNYSQAVRDLHIFYGCNFNTTGVFPNNFTCLIDGRESGGFYADESFLRVQPQNLTDLAIISCNVSIEVPVLRTALDELSNKSSTLQDALKQGFELVYYVEVEACTRCNLSGGICGSDSHGEFLCLCGDHAHRRVCQNGDEVNVKRKLIVGFGAAGFTVLVMGFVFFIYYRRNKNRYAIPSWVSRNISCHPSSMADLEKAGTYCGVQIFSYSQLEKATDNFDSKKELGDGGFGTVYQGKLKDGRVVAVKRLYEHNYKRVEQFMNEVEILTRLRHQNLVSLYGCTSRHCRELLLVYEYVPNGTVADHLHGVRAKPGTLSWTTRMSIAIETASALTYLHASDVIHRDVKTNNILLDNNFGVKVADFGLSRLFPNDVTHVSTAPQGTPGYVDPEYHECYQLTDKSDVYSFGVVLIELISSKPAVDITRHRHEINLANMAINKIQTHALHELVDPCLGFESDYNVRMMISDVAELAFECLQNDGDMRPSMEKVLEDLKRIKGEDCDMKTAEEVEIPADDVVLLKSDPPTLSPDSVMASWILQGTTPNPSI